MPEEQKPLSKSFSKSEILVHKTSPGRLNSYSSDNSNTSLVPEVDYASCATDPCVDSLKSSENQPLLGRLQCDTMFNHFPGMYLIL